MEVSDGSRPVALFFFLLLYLSFSLLCAFCFTLYHSIVIEALSSLNYFTRHISDHSMNVRKCMTKKTCYIMLLMNPHLPIQRVLVVCVSENTY